MKSFYILTIICSLLFLNCGTSKKTKAVNKCDENIEFKTVFMSHINEVDMYTKGNGKREKYDEGLKFLANYVHISYEETMNYANEYTNYDVFKKDKDNWIKWYEENKCKNLQFR